MYMSDPVDGFRLAYDRVGEGPSVMSLHGWPGDRTDFAAVAEILKTDADVIAADMRGFGESDKHPDGGYTAVAQARSVIGLMDELGIEEVVLAGYDVGSRVAQVIAQEYPSRVRALVVAPPLPGPGRRVLDGDIQHEFWYQSFHQLPLAGELLDGRPDAVRAYLRYFWSHWSGPDFTPSDDRLDHLAQRYGVPGAFTASISWYRAGSATVRRSLSEQPPAVPLTVPITVLWPEFDPLFPTAWSDRLDEWYSNVDLQYVKGVGHFSPVEVPHIFADAIGRVVTCS
jgi:pimeloyl-ACP methyl ester carboxylesterase